MSLASVTSPANSATRAGAGGRAGVVSGNSGQTAPGAAVSASSGTPEHRRLTQAAQQFEGMLLQQMLKPMTEHGFGVDGTGEDGQSEEDDSSGGAGGVLSGFATESVANAIAQGGGLGLAKLIVAKVEREAAHGSASRPASQTTAGNGTKEKSQNKAVTVLKSP